MASALALGSCGGGGDSAYRFIDTTPSATPPAPTVRQTLAFTGITALQCFEEGSDDLVSCSSAGAIALSGEGKQDGMRVKPFDFRRVSKPGGGTYELTECYFDANTGLTWTGLSQGDPSVRVAEVNRLALCGYSDWRLPDVIEMMGLINFGTWRFGTPADANWIPNGYGPVQYRTSLSHVVIWFDGGVHPLVESTVLNFSVGFHLVR